MLLFHFPPLSSRGSGFLVVYEAVLFPSFALLGPVRYLHALWCSRCAAAVPSAASSSSAALEFFSILYHLFAQPVTL